MMSRVCSGFSGGRPSFSPSRSMTRDSIGSWRQKSGNATSSTSGLSARSLSLHSSLARLPHLCHAADSAVTKSEGGAAESMVDGDISIICPRCGQERDPAAPPICPRCSYNYFLKGQIPSPPRLPPSIPRPWPANPDRVRAFRTSFWAWRVFCWAGGSSPGSGKRA